MPFRSVVQETGKKRRKKKKKKKKKKKNKQTIRAINKIAETKSVLNARS
jgi:hypothetical protein